MHYDYFQSVSLSNCIFIPLPFTSYTHPPTLTSASLNSIILLNQQGLPRLVVKVCHPISCLPQRPSRIGLNYCTTHILNLTIHCLSLHHHPVTTPYHVSSCYLLLPNLSPYTPYLKSQATSLYLTCRSAILHTTVPSPLLYLTCHATSPYLPSPGTLHYSLRDTLLPP